MKNVTIFYSYGRKTELFAIEHSIIYVDINDDAYEKMQEATRYSISLKEKSECKDVTALLQQVCKLRGDFVLFDFSFVEGCL